MGTNRVKALLVVTTVWVSQYTYSNIIIMPLDQHFHTLYKCIHFLYLYDSCWAHTYRSLGWAVVGHQGEDDHGQQVGHNTDVEGDGSKLLPLGSQQLVDGLHSQHLMAILGTVQEDMH